MYELFSDYVLKNPFYEVEQVRGVAWVQAVVVACQVHTMLPCCHYYVLRNPFYEVEQWRGRADQGQSRLEGWNTIR